MPKSLCRQSSAGVIVLVRGSLCRILLQPRQLCGWEHFASSGSCDGRQGMQYPLQELVCAGVSLAAALQCGWMLHHPSWPANLASFWVWDR